MTSPLYLRPMGLFLRALDAEAIADPDAIPLPSQAFPCPTPATTSPPLRSPSAPANPPLAAF